jgi:hypothetical protein
VSEKTAFTGAEDGSGAFGDIPAWSVESVLGDEKTISADSHIQRPEAL